MGDIGSGMKRFANLTLLQCRAEVVQNRGEAGETFLERAVSKDRPPPRIVFFLLPDDNAERCAHGHANLFGARI